MRTDENGKTCPETLREYRVMCVAFGGEGCDAVVFLDNKAATEPDGLEAVVLAPDSQMRALLMPMLFKYLDLKQGPS